MFTMVKIAIDPVELFIESHIVFVAFYLGSTTTPLVIESTLGIALELSPK